MKKPKNPKAKVATSKGRKPAIKNDINIKKNKKVKAPTDAGYIKNDKVKKTKGSFKKHDLAFSSFDTYIPTELQDIATPELRKEYTRLRDIAQKRIKRLGQSYFKNSEAYKYNEDRFKLLKDIKTDHELRMLLSDLSKFVNSPSSTIRGQWDLVNRRIEGIKRKLPGIIIPDNTHDRLLWFKFMDYMIDKHGVDIKYHVSAATQRAIAYDEQVKDLISKGEYDQAKEYLDQIKGDYQRDEDKVTKEEIEGYFRHE